VISIPVRHRGRGSVVLVLTGALLALVTLPVSAEADLVGQFDAAIRNIRPWGAYTVVASTRVYETSGDPAPRLASAVVHFPRGASLREAFRRKRFFCDPAILQKNPDPALCRNAQFASGSLLLDARPAILDPIPADISLFLAQGGKRGSSATVVALVKSNQRSPAYNYEVLEGFLVQDSGDRRFGYRLELPTLLHPLLPEVTLSLIEMKLRITGLALSRRVRVCATRGRGGRCLRRRTRQRKLFWLKVPECPRGRKVTFGADYAFQGGSEISRKRKVGCSRFLDLPTAHRKGRIPGAPG
jgi:hypothetical protein